MQLSSVRRDDKVVEALVTKWLGRSPIELIREHLSANEGVPGGPKNSSIEKDHFQVAVATRYGISAFGLGHDAEHLLCAHRAKEPLFAHHAEHLLCAHRAEELLCAHRGALPDSIAFGSRAFAPMTAFEESKTRDCASASWRAPESF